MPNSIRKYMKGGEGETENSRGWTGWFGVNNKKPDTGNNDNNKSVISTLTDTVSSKTNDILGRRQSGESMTSHLNGEIEKLKKEKIDLENKFKSDVQKMIEENKQKQEAETKKRQDDLNSKIKDLEKKISDLMKEKQDVFTQSQKEIADSGKIAPTTAPTTAPTSTTVGGGRRRNIKKNKSHKKRSIKKNKKTRKKKHYKKTRSKKH